MLSSNYWEARISNIKSTVSLRNLVDYFNVATQSMGEITQVHCPFHSGDLHASARIYETNTMYCWVCSRVWDVISFVSDIKGISFAEACTILEEMYGIEKTDKSIAYHEESFNDFLKSKEPIKEKDFDRNFEKISSLLIKNRESFSLDEYSKYFYFFDSLYVAYKANDHSNDNDLGNSLDNLFKEILAKQ